MSVTREDDGAEEGAPYLQTLLYNVGLTSLIHVFQGF